MHGKGAWRDNIFVERLWRSIKYEKVYLRGYDSVSEACASIGQYLTFYTVGGPTRALTAKHPIKLTSPRCHSAWQPNRGRRSTYRRGKTVQTTETTSLAAVSLPLQWKPERGSAHTYPSSEILRQEAS